MTPPPKPDGYILLWRSIEEHKLWRGKFSRGQALVDLFLERVVKLPTSHAGPVGERR